MLDSLNETISNSLKNYSVDILGRSFKMYRNNSNFKTFTGEYQLENIVEMLKNKEIAVGEFDVDGINGKLQDFIVAQRLNEWLGVATHNTFVLLFGNLDKMISKKEIVLPDNFEDLFPGNTQKTYELVNQVLWLKPETIDSKILNSYRHDLKNLLKYNKTVTVDDILNANSSALGTLG